MKDVNGAELQVGDLVIIKCDKNEYRTKAFREYFAEAEKQIPVK